VIFLAGLLYWFPKMFGRMYSKRSAYLSGVLFFIGFNLTYLPLFVGGALGMPRRYADYLPEYTLYHQLSTVGSWILVGSLLHLFANLLLALRRGAPAPANPWGGVTLEWSVPSPPPLENFDELPVVTGGPYDFPTEVADA